MRPLNSSNPFRLESGTTKQGSSGRKGKPSRTSHLSSLPQPSSRTSILQGFWRRTRTPPFGSAEPIPNVTTTTAEVKEKSPAHLSAGLVSGHRSENSLTVRTKPTTNVGKVPRELTLRPSPHAKPRHPLAFLARDASTAPAQVSIAADHPRNRAGSLPSPPSALLPVHQPHRHGPSGKPSWSSPELYENVGDCALEFQKLFHKPVDYIATNFSPA